MNCDDYQQHLSAMIDNELHDNESKRVFAHLSVCDGCRSFFQTLIQLRSTLSAEQQIDVPATLAERITSMQPGIAPPLRLETRFMAWWRHRLAIPVPAFALAIMIGLLVSALSISLWLKQTDLERQKSSNVVFVVDMQAIEVQASYIPVQ